MDEHIQIPSSPALPAPVQLGGVLLPEAHLHGCPGLLSTPDVALLLDVDALVIDMPVFTYSYSSPCISRVARNYQRLAYTNAVLPRSSRTRHGTPRARSLAPSRARHRLLDDVLA